MCRNDYCLASGAAWQCVVILIVMLIASVGAADRPVPQSILSGRILSADEATAAAESDKAHARWRPHCVDLSPARWIWLPSERTLPNTFVLFRKELQLDRVPARAAGWITADSRYRLTVNGHRVQWGPAPCDPRNLDVDPFDITAHLRPGKNVIGVEVLYYGIGEGTWAAGKPGLLFHAAIDRGGGQTQAVVSDTSWQTFVDRAHRPSQPKRWFLRALQEEFDARLHPYGWDTPEFECDDRWIAAMALDCPPDKPAACGPYQTTDSIDRADPAASSLRMRQIPLVRESDVPAQRLAESGRVTWLRDPADWFDFRIPESFRVASEPVASEEPPGAWTLPGTADREGLFLTFELEEQVVGWPYFTIEAPAGTVVELMTQESHDRARTRWLDSQFYAWTRFICRGGVERFEPFDYESLRWIQLHIRGASGPVKISGGGVRRRTFDWPIEPRISCPEPALQRLFDASINTLRNSAIETVVDGMARERQQYSGDGGHQLHAIRYAFGEPRIAARFLRTFSEGQARDGYFLDCWPAYDRLARVAQKQVDGAFWGPLLDHGVGFAFDCWHHYLETGDLAALEEPYPRLLRFADYLEALRGDDGLLPVENLGIPTVWIDHSAYRRPRHKQCAFNLYTAAMLRHALAPIAEAFGQPDRAAELRRRADDIQRAAVERFWSEDRGLFVDNLPWLVEEKTPRLSDRSLATAILFDQCPGGRQSAALEVLANCPPEMGLSYPCNAGWRLWALAKLGRADVAVDDFRHRWATMRSVIENNTLQEDWNAPTDSRAQWSHCAVVPLYVLFQDIAGIRPTEPGFTRYQVRPQLANLGGLDVTAFTAIGPVRLAADRDGLAHRVQLTVPARGEGELLVPANVELRLDRLQPDHPLGLRRYRLPAGKSVEFQLPW